jgi:tetratricopeptide (TPR) repeat protein
MARLFSILSLAQIASLLALLGIVVESALCVWHETDDYFSPWSEYLLSFKVALPPLALFAGTYVIAFVTGIPVGDVPKSILSFLRNRFFQTYRWMGSLTLVFAIFTLYTASLLFRTAPSYETFIEELMGGEQDDLAAAHKTLKVILDRNPRFAAELQLATDVFGERSDVNTGRKSLSVERARIFIRALETSADESWRDNPLRWHALAEANLLYAQSVERSLPLATSGDSLELAKLVKQHGEAAINLYTRVSLATGPLAPLLLRRSAKNNIGNAYYYLQNYPLAVREWAEANSSKYEGPNTSSWANLIAGYVLIGRPLDAIREGTAAKNWAEENGKAVTEAPNYAGIVGNMGYAKIQLGKIDEGLADLVTANAAVEDNLSLQDLAMGYALAERSSEAQSILRKIRPPATSEDEAALVAAGHGGECLYLLWILANPKAPPQETAANGYAFLGEAHSISDLNRATDNSNATLIKRVAEFLPVSPEPCAGISKLPPVMAQLGSISAALAALH